MSLAALMVSLLIGGTASAQATRVSTALGDVEANGASSAVATSADGRIVAFISEASNLVPGDTNGAADVFVKDRQTGVVTRVNVTAARETMPGTVERPGLSADGRYVVFTTTSALVPEDTNVCSSEAPDGCKDVYVFDRTTGLPSRVSISTGGAQGDAASLDGHISGDGRYVVFRSAATTLVANATGNGTTVYVRDLQLASTTRIPIAGALGFFPSSSVRISGDGQVVVFTADNLLLDQHPTGCAGRREACIGQVLYAYARQDGQTARYIPKFLGNFAPPGPSGDLVHDTLNVSLRGVSNDGRAIAYLETHDIPGSHIELPLVFDRTTTKSTHVLQDLVQPVRDVAISGDGRWAATCTPLVGIAPNQARLQLYDVLLKSFVPIKAGVPETLPDCDSVALTSNGLLVFFASPDTTLIAGDANGQRDVFAFNADADGDGLPSSWETQFGLNPNDPNDAALDADGDGVSNALEYVAVTHPNGAWKRYFAEGAANAFFDTRLDLMNPGAAPVTALLTYLGANGRTAAKFVTLAPQQHVPLALFDDVSIFDGGSGATVNTPDQTFSTVIESTGQVVAERTMSWPAQSSTGRYGSHAETAILEPRTEWHFAEGATSPYSLYYLLQNPNSAETTVTITYMLPAPQPPITRVYTVGPRTRQTIDVGGEPGLAQAEVAAKLTSTLPILAERAMYLSAPGQLYAAGHDGAAIASPANEWFIAEGATGFFSLYYTISNPSATSDAAIVVKYLLPDGTSFDRPHVVGKQARLTIDVAGEDPRLLSSEVSGVIRSTNSVPVVAERVMWWPRGAPYEASLTAGTTETGRRWAVATALYFPGPPAYHTYLLVANPTSQAGSFTVTLRHDFNPGVMGTCARTFALPAHSRKTVDIPTVCEGVIEFANGGFFSGIIESSGPGIVAERSTYFSTIDTLWTAGASVALTRLPDVP